MSKRSIYTVITPLPGTITRETAIETLHNHTEMIELNPLVIKHETTKPPQNAPADEFHCIWYELTDKIQYMPGVKGNVSYKACFHDLPRGIQTHVYAPTGLEIKEKWSIGGNVPGEPREPLELGLAEAPREGLYLREDVDMRCNMLMLSFVKKNLKKAHAVLVDRMVLKAQIAEEKKESMSSVSGFGSARQSSMLTGGSGSVRSDGDSWMPGNQQQGMLSPGQQSAFSPTQTDFRSSMMSQIQRPYSPNMPAGFRPEDYATVKETMGMGPRDAIHPSQRGAMELPGEYPPPAYRSPGQGPASPHNFSAELAGSDQLEPGLAPAPLRPNSSLKSPQPHQTHFELE